MGFETASRILLEVIVQSIADARAAAEGGADRLEVVRDIRLAGLTPLASLVRAIAAETALPIRVMVRENAGYGTDAAELVRMCRAAATFADLEVNGLVIGFARERQLMLSELREVLQSAASLPVTFHRAFDSLVDPLRAIDTLSEIPQIDRILTDGIGSMREVKGRPHRCARLRQYVDRAGSRLTIIAGGEVDEEMLSEIALTRCVTEAHVGRAARDGRDREARVDSARVRRLRAILDRLP
jgi:copper homeostasis protein CutC